MSSSSLLHSPLHHFLPPSSSPSPSSFPILPLTSRPLLFRLRNVEGKRGNFTSRSRVPPMASLNQQQVGPTDTDSFKRRALLILGISAFSFLPPNNQVLASEEEERNGKKNQDSKQNRQRSPPSNPILSLLNAIGLFGASVLAALYSLARKDQRTSEAVIESLNSQLKEKDATIVSLKKNFQSRLLNLQEEQNKLLNKAKEEQQFLVTRLEAANTTIAGLGRELQTEKKNKEQLQGDIGNLENELDKSVREKQALEEEVMKNNSSISVLQERVNLLSAEIKGKEEVVQRLTITLTEKELDLTNLKSSNKQTLDELDGLNSEILLLKGDILEYRKEIEQKKSLLDNLNDGMNTLIVEREDLTSQLKTLQHEYDDLRSSSEKRAADDIKVLEGKEQELLELKERYQLVADKISEKEIEISELLKDRDSLQNRFNLEAERVKILSEELALRNQDLDVSQKEGSKLQGLLGESREVCSKLEAELAEVQTHLSETRASLENKLGEAKDQMDALTSELSSVKEELNRTKNELREKSSELAATSESREALQKELLEVYQKTENIANDLKEERNLVAALNNELEGLEKDLLKDKETRKSLETNLKVATESLDEMNKTTLILSKELETSNSRVSSLEEEKTFLKNSSDKEKKFAQEARENLEDAHNLVMKLGSERETWEKRARILEEDLASTKGEILRLRAQVNSSKTVVKDEPEEGDGAVVSSQTKRRTKTAAKKEPKKATETTVNGGFEQKTELAGNGQSQTATEVEPVKKSTRRRKAK